MKTNKLHDTLSAKDFSFLSKRTGYFPVNNIGRWHSGIMVEFAPEEKLYVPVSGIVRDFCFDDDKENYILLENKITIPLKNKKTEELSCYSFISNFKHHEKIKRYLNEETYFYKLKCDKINEFPVCIETEIGDINSGVNYIAQISSFR